MKFLALALTAVVGLTEGKKIGSAEINRRMQNGLVNKSVLMRGAKPFNEAAKRKLEEEAWEITGEYSIVFDKCTSMTVQNDEVYEDETLAAMASNGDLVSDKDFIVFDVCKTKYCSSGNGSMKFIADVGTYFSAISQYLPSKVEQYCQACEESYDYCYAMSKGYTYYPEGYDQEEEQQEDEAEEEEQQEDEAEEEQAEEEDAEEEQAEEGEGERKSRKLAQNDEVVKFIDCDMCAEYECLDFQQSSKGYYDENGDFVEAQLDDAMEWLNGFSECSETNAYMDDLPIYAGLMCNAKGTGIEIGLFMDDDCSLYTSKLSYKSIMQTSDTIYYNMVSDVVEFTFNNDGIECYNPEVTWYNEVDYYYEQMEKAANGEEEEEEAEDEEYEAPEAAEWCQGIVGEGSSAPLYGCDIDADEDAQEEEEEQDEDGNNYPVDYELTEEQMDDISSVCSVYTGMTAPAYASSSSSSSSSSGSSSYTPHTIYNPNHETLFDYKKGSAASTAGKAIGWIVLVGVVGAGAAYFFMQKKSTGDKKAPLIAENEGTMA